MHYSLCLGKPSHFCCAFAKIGWYSQDTKQNILRRLLRNAFTVKEEFATFGAKVENP